MAEAETDRKSTLREYYEALLIAVIFVNFARIFVFQAFKIPTGSMIDNLLVGDHIIVNKFAYGPPGTALFEKLFPFREIHRGDIIVFRFPDDPNTDFVKRVIGLPNDTIVVRDKKVFVNGTAQNEPYTVHEDPQIIPLRPALLEPYRSRDQFGPYTVPPDKYFAMGDNRDRSNDSRYWGPVPRSLIKGRAFLVYWSFRGVPPDPRSPAAERVKELAGVMIHFLTRTRWDRTFLIVDSKYHYHAEPDDVPNE
ncbi:MAG TPA: signal peptidase I [Thermoanaerobaculia bacterium]|nr:signal peptidase I [Thermoanaerobaculia bacterium]